MRAPVSGKIRAGTKVLTRAAEANPKAVEIYRAGVAAGRHFADIEKDIRSQCKIDRSPLTPRNIPHFRIVRRDFTVPETADRIVELYGEDRNNGLGRQVYRFPVVFAFDDWLQNMPHNLRSFTASGLKYWSEYDATGTRYCMTYATPEQKNARAARAWGGRRVVVREENGGRCDPSACPQYQSRTCTLGGRLLFYIPGIPGSSLIELDTTSFYSLQQIRSQLELVAGLRAGRLSGTHQGKAIFTLAKVEEEVTMLDDSGQPTKKKQFLVNIEASLGMTEMMAANENALSDGRRAAAALSGPKASDVIDVAATVLPAPAPTPSEASPSSDSASLGTLEPGAAETCESVTALIREKLAARGADVDTWRADMTAVHGRGWSKQLATLRTILAKLEGKP